MGFELLDEVRRHGAEQVIMAADADTGLQVIVAIHSTVLGRASAARASTPSGPSGMRWWTRCASLGG